MDMSVVEGEEKPVAVNEVQEYAAEIHTYLREMEVRNTIKLNLCLTFFQLGLAGSTKHEAFLEMHLIYLKCMIFACK